jgi:hypothetical protein
MKRIDVPCLVDIEQSPESLHAHAIPDGIDIHPGDCVLVHDAPWRIGYGERVFLECSATVTRAGAFGRFWAHLTAPLNLVELFEVGFQPKEST